MKRGRLPLTALRSFEAAGRHLSFTAAAEELCISQAAVSRQIRELERILGHAVFERMHRQVILTPVGEELLAVMTRSFDDIDDAMKAALARERSTSFRITAEPSFAGRWLVPHLAEFQQAHPDIDLVLDSDPRLIDFRRDQPQLAIRHSEDVTAWPRSESRALFDVNMIAVIAPQLAASGARIDEPEDLLRHVLLHEDSHDLWARWFAAAGSRNITPARGPVYADGALVQQAAIEGQGIGLVDEVFARDDLLAGRLQRLFECSVAYGRYYLVARRFDQLSESGVAFANWLSRAFACAPEPH